MNILKGLFTQKKPDQEKMKMVRVLTAPKEEDIGFIQEGIKLMLEELERRIRILKDEKKWLEKQGKEYTLTYKELGVKVNIPDSYKEHGIKVNIPELDKGQSHIFLNARIKKLGDFFEMLKEINDELEKLEVLKESKIMLGVDNKGTHLSDIKRREGFLVGKVLDFLLGPLIKADLPVPFKFIQEVVPGNSTPPVWEVALNINNAPKEYDDDGDTSDVLNKGEHDENIEKINNLSKMAEVTPWPNVEEAEKKVLKNSADPRLKLGYDILKKADGSRPYPLLVPTEQELMIYDDGEWEWWRQMKMHWIYEERESNYKNLEWYDSVEPSIDKLNDLLRIHGSPEGITWWQWRTHLPDAKAHKLEPEADSEAEVKAGAEPEPEAGVEAGAELGPEPEPKAGPEPKARPDSEAGPEPKAGPGPGPGPEAGPDSETDSEEDSEAARRKAAEEAARRKAAEEAALALRVEKKNLNDHVNFFITTAGKKGHGPEPEPEARPGPEPEAEPGPEAGSEAGPGPEASNPPTTRKGTIHLPGQLKRRKNKVM